MLLNERMSTHPRVLRISHWISGESMWSTWTYLYCSLLSYLSTSPHSSFSSASIAKLKIQIQIKISNPTDVAERCYLLLTNAIFHRSRKSIRFDIPHPCFYDLLEVRKSSFIINNSFTRIISCTSINKNDYISTGLPSGVHQFLLHTQTISSREGCR